MQRSPQLHSNLRRGGSRIWRARLLDVNRIAHRQHKELKARVSPGQAGGGAKTARGQILIWPALRQICYKNWFILAFDEVFIVEAQTLFRFILRLFPTLAGRGGEKSRAANPSAPWLDERPRSGATGPAGVAICQSRRPRRPDGVPATLFREFQERPSQGKNCCLLALHGSHRHPSHRVRPELRLWPSRKAPARTGPEAPRGHRIRTAEENHRLHQALLGEPRQPQHVNVAEVFAGILARGVAGRSAAGDEKRGADWAAFEARPRA